MRIWVAVLGWVASSVCFAQEGTAGEAPVVQHLSRAIGYQTVSYQDRDAIDYSAFRGFQQFLRDTYPTVFHQLQVDLVADHSMVLTWPGRNVELKAVLLDSHYDVVPIEPGTQDDWEHPPFEGVIADGFLWGRGAIDDKASVIATLEAVEALLLEGFEPERTLLFSLAHDEEIGGGDGAANIVKHLAGRDIDIDYMIGEGGLIVDDNPFVAGKPVAMIGLAEKAYVTLTLKATGTGGHSSMPVEDNAIVRLANAVKALHENPFDPQLVPPVTDMLTVLGEEIGGIKGFMMRNQWLSGPIMLSMLSKDRVGNSMVRTTTAVTMFNAGVKENVISQNAHAKINFRLLPGYTPDQLMADVRAIIDDELVVIESEAWKASPPVADRNGEGYRRVKEAINSIYPAAVVSPSLLTATTDSPHYAQLVDNIYRFHPFRLSMADTGSIHNTNERIAIDAVVLSVQLSKALIRSVAAQ